MRRPHFLDIRTTPPGDVPKLLESAWLDSQRGLLSLSARPYKHWTKGLLFARPLILSSSALYELILWVDLEFDLTLPATIVAEQQSLLENYTGLFADPREAHTRIEEYQRRLRTHINGQESFFFPDLLRSLPELERPIRELTYEHRGLEKGVQALTNAVTEGESLSDLSPRDRERWDLDFYHLLEHHIERERDALYPAWLFLSQGVDSV